MIPFLQQLPRKSLYILGLVAVVLLGSGYFTWLTVAEAGGKLSIEKQTESADRALLQMSQASNVESVQAELAAIQGQLKEAAFPEQLPSVEVVALLVKASRETGVGLGNFQLLAVEQEKVGNSNYNVMKQRLQLWGNPTQVSAFLSRLETGGFRSLVTNNLSMSPKGDLWEARLDMYLYSTR